ncbi:MAG: autotransporter outer membrane beta-barrel domain-containing protein [Devosia sp.]
MLISTTALFGFGATQNALAQVVFADDTDPGNPAGVDGTTDLGIGVSSAGTLSITGGATLTSAYSYLGQDVGGNGTGTVSGAGSTWTSTGALYVGNLGTGTLNIDNGGVVSSLEGIVGPDGAGHVFITGAGSQWNTAGRLDIGLGDITLENLAAVTSDDGIVGNSAHGEATLRTGASWINVGQFTVGLFAEGELRVESGARVVSNQGYVGANLGGDGTVTVTGAGSSWEMTGSSLSLGNFGTGAMTIADGAWVFAKTGVRLGSQAGASGTLTVQGTAGSRGVIETNVFMGGDGTADVTIDGGTVRATDDNPNFFNTFGSQQITLGAAGGFFDTNGRNIGIAPEMVGAGTLIKQGGGTLTLRGANSYAGGTVIEAGTLQLGNGGTTGSIIGDVSTDGTLAFNRSDSVIFGGLVSGTGGIRQIGTGTTTLTGNSAGLLGVSGVYDGILSVNGVLGGSMEVRGGRLQGIGQVGTTSNFAGGTIAPGNSIGTLTIAGNYVGNGGTLEIETVLGDDGSATDRLIVSGDTSGSTNVRVLNLGGTGAQTTEGIRIVDVGGVSNGSFTLLGSYTFEGAPAVVGGAYAYRLYQGGISTPADGDWYLRSALITATGPAGPVYQAGAPIYETYATVLQSFSALETLQQRLGNRSWSAGVVDKGALPDAAGIKSGIWARIIGRHASIDPQFSTTGADLKIGTWQLQAGTDGELYSGDAGTLLGGLSARFGTISGEIASVFGDGTISSSGYGVGGSLTWYGVEGFYLDGQANLTGYDSTLASTSAATRLVSGNGGFGYALSLEAGQQLQLTENWSVTPQAQVNYSSTSHDGFTDVFGAAVSRTEGNDLDIRLGLSADYRNTWTDQAGETNRLHAYGLANLYYDLAPRQQTSLAGVNLASMQDPWWGGLGIGGTYNWGDGQHAIHGEATLDTSLSNFARSYALKGTVAFTSKF